MNKSLVAVFVLLIIILNVRLWFKNGSVHEVIALNKTIEAEQGKLEFFKTRNKQLETEVDVLKKYPEAIEEQARYELGMIKEGETYIQFVEPIG